jgi:subtilisin family serine protease
MKRFEIILILLCFFSLMTQGQQTKNFAGDRIIGKFKSTCMPFYSQKAGVVVFGLSAVDELNAKYNCATAKRLNAGRKNKSSSYTYVFQFAGNVDINTVIQAYIATGCFEYVEPDFAGKAGGSSVTPNDQFFSNQWALSNNGTFPYDSAKAGADIKMEQAWGIEEGDSSVVVAIIDCGAKLDHPEFLGRIWVNYGEIPGNGIDDDGNGYIDDVQGWNFAYNNNNPTDDYGHGTNVTGIIGANGNNNIGYAGVDWHCKLMILKAIDSTNFGYYSWWAEAINYAVNNGANVINMSLEGTSYSQTLQNAVTDAYNSGLTIVACMGNYDTSAPSYPGACINVIAVGATNDHDCRVNPFFWGGGSDYGPNISVVAPGDYIYGLNYLSNTDYSYYWGGTSQATPHVSGLASLLLAQDPTRTPDQIKHIIEVTADDTVGNRAEDTPGWDQYYGYGRINAYRALSYSATGIEAVNTSIDNVKIYPNPTDGQMLIQLKQVGGPLTFSVINNIGAVVMDGTLTNANNQINLSAYPKGAYLIKVNSNDLNFVQKEIIR